MPTAFIHQRDCRIRLKSERLEVWGRNAQTSEEELLREIPLRDVERVTLFESVSITSQALSALLKRNIPVYFMAWNNQVLGSFLPATTAQGLARLRQYRRSEQPGFTCELARRLVNAKLYNQRRVIQRLALNRKQQNNEPEAAADPLGTETQAALEWLESLFASINVATTVDEIRGYEGAATARYFRAWSAFLPAQFPFERRTTRPPQNPVNACISFGATLLYNEAVAFIQARGLDPSLGIMHATEDGRWSLALDLIEPFRPVFVEALALDLFSHKILNAGCFEPKKGGVYLNEEGRGRFLVQYERRLERQFMSESAGHRTTLRRQLEQQVLLYKAALEDPERFEPFVMN